MRSSVENSDFVCSSSQKYFVTSASMEILFISTDSNELILWNSINSKSSYNMTISIRSLTAKSITDINILTYLKLYILRKILKLVPRVVWYSCEASRCYIILGILRIPLILMTKIVALFFGNRIFSIAWGNEKEKDLSDEDFIHRTF